MNIEIVDYHPKYSAAFRSLNKEWIDKYFVMEETDYKSLDHPDEYIIQKGGHIVVVLQDKIVVGVCALIKMDHPKYSFELAKMAVKPGLHGQGIGLKLGQAVINKAKSERASAIYLESNTILASAIHLYRKLGFVEVHNVYTPYSRCNIQMELILT